MRPFEDIVAEHGALVMRVCRSMLASADAEDAWSETFLSAMRAYPDLRPDSNVRGWLVTIARRKAIDQTRRTKRVRPSDAVPDPGIWDQPALTNHALREAIHDLPPKQQGAVIYRYVADLAYAEVGELLDCSQAAARRSAADGIAVLRTSYSQEHTS